MKKRGGKIDREKDAKRQLINRRIQQEIDSNIEKASTTSYSSLPGLGPPDLLGDRDAFDKSGKRIGVYVTSGNMKRLRKPTRIA